MSGVSNLTAYHTSAYFDFHQRAGTRTSRKPRSFLEPVVTKGPRVAARDCAVLRPTAATHHTTLIINPHLQQYKRRIKRAGLPYIRPHDLRHTAATLLLLEGVQPLVVSEMLGHASVAFTLATYGHVQDVV
jgi:integrase